MNERENTLSALYGSTVNCLSLLSKLAESTVSKYMPRLLRRPPSSQSWRTFLRNHAIAAIDLWLRPSRSKTIPSVRRKARARRTQARTVLSIGIANHVGTDNRPGRLKVPESEE
jgi:hypothetical protein